MTDAVLDTEETKVIVLDYIPSGCSVLSGDANDNIV